MLHIQSNISLLPYNAFQIDVRAKYFVEISTIEELQELFQTDIFRQEKRQILGWGTNILFTDNFEWLIIKIALKGRELIEENPSSGSLHVRVAAGENRSDFVEYANAQWRAGIENLIAIPGNVGTAPVSNIGAYGMEIGNRIIRVEGYNLETLQYQTFLHSQCNFAYRNSVFKSELKNTFLITAVVFALQRFDESYQCMIDYADLKSQLENQHPLTLHKVSQLIAEVRASKLPDHTKIGTAGSFFANPIVDPQHLESLKTEYPEMPHRGTKLSAGRLIEKAGLKWYSNGKSWTSPNHALIVINQGGTAADVLEVVERIQQTVKDKFNIALIPEVVYV